jgi:hypothetical protein
MSGAQEHFAVRPSWDCGTCEKPWPCDPARERLSAEMDATQLRIFMWLNLEQAAEQLPGLAVDEAFHRFLAWTDLS